MKYELVPLNVHRLMNAELDEFIATQLSDLGNNLPPVFEKTDNVYQQYFNDLSLQHGLFHQSQEKMMVNTATRAIIEADHERDIAFSVIVKLIDAATHSNVDAERNAADVLELLLKNYKGLTRLNYDAETARMDNLVADLENASFAPHIQTLALQRYVTRLKNANNTFKMVISNRGTAEFLTEGSDTGVLRHNLLSQYRELTLFVQAMANTPNGGLYQQMLKLINNVRDHFAIRLAQRKGTAESKIQQQETATPSK